MQDTEDFIAPCPSAECDCAACVAYTTGVDTTERITVRCPHCLGKGSVGTGDNPPECRRCHGELEVEVDLPEDCPICGGPLLTLGMLGNVLHSRCRNCGIDHSVTVS